MPSKWTPRLYLEKGRRVFCSEVCGGGYTTCSLKAYKDAIALSNAAVRRMGPGWKAVPFENLGWHPVVENKKMGARIHIDVVKTKAVFSCELIHDGHQVWGRPSKTPIQALNSARDWLESMRLRYVNWLKRTAYRKDSL